MSFTDANLFWDGNSNLFYWFCLLLANTRQEKRKFGMPAIHDESRCNGCNIVARACRKTNHVPAQGSRLSIAHIPVTDNDNETQYHFFASHVSTAKMLRASTYARQGRRGVAQDRAGKKNRSIGCSYCIGALSGYRVRLPLTLSLKWQINVISALSPDWQKAFRPFASAPVRNTH